MAMTFATSACDSEGLRGEEESAPIGSPGGGTGAADEASEPETGHSNAETTELASSQTERSHGVSTPQEDSSARERSDGNSPGSAPGSSTSLQPNGVDTGIPADTERSNEDSASSEHAAPGTDAVDTLDTSVFFRELPRAGGPPITLHPDPLDGSRYGTGLALVDFDGSGALDLFVGSDGEGVHEACLYRNLSTAQELRLEPWEGACGNLGEMTTGVAVPSEDGTSEHLLLVGRNAASLLWLSEAGAPMVEEIYRLPSWLDEPESSCMATAALVTDLSLNGEPWVMIGCSTGRQSRLSQRLAFADNRLLHRGPDGWVERTLGDLHPWFHNPASTLAFAMVDSRNNGLWSPLIVNDTFSTLGQRRTEYDPGGVLERCAPGEGCIWRTRLLADDPSAWGSFMGAGQLRIGDADYLYVTDWGPNRLLRMGSTSFEDEADMRDAALAARDQWPLFGWSAVVDDFNDSGRDDLLITNGSPRNSILDDAAHVNVMLLQRADGHFEALAEQFGFPTPNAEESTQEGFLTSSRGAVKADLLQNGRMEILLLDHRGPLRILQEEVPADRPLRCSVDPRPRIGVHTGTGYSFARSPEGPFRTWDIQGHMLIGAPSRLLLPWQQGWLRFPSGAILPWDCEGGAGPLRLEEPDWVRFEEIGPNTWVLSLNLPWLSGDDGQIMLRIAFLSEDPAQPFDLTPVQEALFSLERHVSEHALPLTAPGDATHVMLQFDGRWVPHRFDLGERISAPR